MNGFFATSFSLEPLGVGDVVLRIVLALVLGGAIGVERGMGNHPAGFRTHILVCVGACLAMLTNEFVFHAVGVGVTDPTRIGAQVVSGIGFLGVGTIFMAGRNTVRGLTTAAGLWTAGAIGLAIGIGFYFGALLATGVVLLVIAVFPAVEVALYKNSRRIRLHVETGTLEEEEAVRKFLESANLMLKSKQLATVSLYEGRVSAYYSIHLNEDTNLLEIVGGVTKLPGVRLVEMV